MIMNPETYKRKIIKAMSWRAVSGNWLRSVLVIVLSVIMSALVIRLLPVRIPFPEELVAAETTLEMLMLFVPREIGTRGVASIAVTVLLYLFVIPPFAVGMNRFFISVSRGKKAKLSEAFSVYTSLRDVFSAIFMEIILFAVQIVFFAILVLIFVPLFFWAGKFSQISPIPYLILPFLFCAGVVFVILWCDKYNFARYILADGKNGGALSSFRACLKLVAGRYGECIKLRASYLIWDAASAYVAPVAIIYQIISKTVYAKFFDYLKGDVEFVETKPPMM